MLKILIAIWMLQHPVAKWNAAAISPIRYFTMVGNCTILQSYTPKNIECTYCLCFPNNWYNCWTKYICPFQSQLNLQQHNTNSSTAFIPKLAVNNGISTTNAGSNNIKLDRMSENTTSSSTRNSSLLKNVTTSVTS